MGVDNNVEQQSSIVVLIDISYIREELNLSIQANSTTVAKAEEEEENNWLCFKCHVSHVTCHLSPDHLSKQLQLHRKPPKNSILFEQFQEETL